MSPSRRLACRASHQVDGPRRAKSTTEEDEMTPRARSRLRQVELRPHGLGDEVDVLLEVIRDVGADERAHRDHLELVLARVIKDVAYERGTETLTFVGVVDLGVGESPTPGMVVVVREAGDLTVDRDLEPMLPGVLRNPRL